MRKMKWLYGIVALLTVCFLTSAQAADFPTKDISGIIQWGAGGATDNVSRATTPYVENALGKQIVLQNKPGATGAVGLMQVYNQPADGYTLLYGAENPTLYKVLDISQIDYDAFYPVMLIARNVGVDRLQQRPALENPRRSVRRRQKEPRPGQDGIDRTGRPSPRRVVHAQGHQRRDL